MGLLCCVTHAGSCAAGSTVSMVAVANRAVKSNASKHAATVVPPRSTVTAGNRSPRTIGPTSERPDPGTVPERAPRMPTLNLSQIEHGDQPDDATDAAPSKIKDTTVSR